MGFELPPDNPLQQLTSTAEALASVVAAYRETLIRGLVPPELADEMTRQYSEDMFRRIYYPDWKPPAPIYMSTPDISDDEG